MTEKLGKGPSRRGSGPVPFILKDYIVYSSSDDFAYKLIFARMSNSTVPFITSTTIRVF